MNKHTPGPWTSTGQWIEATNQAGTGVLATVHAIHVTDQEADANAKIIAAAPDMAEALRLMIGEAELHPSWAKLWCLSEARAALAKAGL